MSAQDEPFESIRQAVQRLQPADRQVVEARGRSVRRRRQRSASGVGAGLALLAVAIGVASARPGSGSETVDTRVEVPAATRDGSPDANTTPPSSAPSTDDEDCPIDPLPEAASVGVSLTVTFDSGDATTFTAHDTTATVHVVNNRSTPISVMSDTTLAVVPIDADGRVLRRPHQSLNAAVADLDLAPGEAGTRPATMSVMPCGEDSTSGQLAAIADVTLADGTRLRVRGEPAS